ncbi:hypothetical protein MAR_036205 [Mya arenaria]|uniref:Uncharacterized protein n=1 Tax=Mya arenaria TaxID=6604 RepID=A0ABY7EPS9_MYAAR|nr:hypothetical protein MAR_036205 [Mya arenaria]
MATPAHSKEEKASKCRGPQENPEPTTLLRRSQRIMEKKKDNGGRSSGSSGRQKGEEAEKSPGSSVRPSMKKGYGRKWGVEVRGGRDGGRPGGGGEEKEWMGRGRESWDGRGWGGIGMEGGWGRGKGGGMGIEGEERKERGKSVEGEGMTEMPEHDSIPPDPVKYPAGQSCGTAVPVGQCKRDNRTILENFTKILCDISRARETEKERNTFCLQQTTNCQYVYPMTKSIFMYER